MTTETFKQMNNGLSRRHRRALREAAAKQQPMDKFQLRRLFMYVDIRDFLETYDKFVNPFVTADNKTDLCNRLYHFMNDDKCFKLALFYRGGYTLKEDLARYFPEFEEIMGFALE